MYIAFFNKLHVSFSRCFQPSNFRPDVNKRIQRLKHFFFPILLGYKTRNIYSALIITQLLKYMCIYLQSYNVRKGEGYKTYAADCTFYIIDSPHSCLRLAIRM